MEKRDILKVERISSIILYTSPDGQVKVDVVFEDDTVWLTQKLMAELFGVEINTINYHIKDIFVSGELREESVIRKFRITAADKKQYLTNFYNLDLIISVGYRVNSRQATQFRIWATRVLREYIIKEFYAVVQNKLHWAIHGHTAAELISRRADASRMNMGLTTWKNAPKGKIRKSDVVIAKNYLLEQELRQLNRIVTMYLDYAHLIEKKELKKRKK